MKITILGAGTWGVALAALLVKNGNEVCVWSPIEEEIRELSRTNAQRNLPGVTLPDGIKYTTDIKSASVGGEMVLFVVPSQFIRATARAVAPHVENGAIVASASKGIEYDTLMTMTEVVEDVFKSSAPCLDYSLAALSGPTHAEEVAAGLPTSIVAASENEEVAMRIAGIFANSNLRVYTNTDVLGVEICGAVKNVIAIAAGINRGMGFGDNSGAMLMTRGMVEITRLGLAMGCNSRTFMGLAGIGDLIVTCTSRHSRNNRCGELIGKGKTYAEAQSEIGMVVEGYHALGATVKLAKKYNVELPITEAVYSIIMNGEAPKDVMLRLMSRDIKSELQR
jgi:glycerol-3-phosphate dehydrogenase (NAD(P)+)